MSQQFVEMVADLRVQQRKYRKLEEDLNRTDRAHEMKNLLPVIRRLEKQVDDWIERNERDREQLSMWSRAVVGQESAGVYDTGHEEGAKKGS